MNRTVILACTTAFLLGVVCTLAAVAMLQPTWRIPSGAAIKTIGVEVYWDSELTNPAQYINWGILDPGDTRNVTLYMVNQGNVPITLSLSTENWQPTNAIAFVTLTWNYDGSTLAVDEVRPVILSLQINPSITGITSFNFDIIITGSG